MMAIVLETWQLTAVIMAGMLAVVVAARILQSYIRHRQAAQRPRPRVTVRTTHVEPGESMEPNPAIRGEPAPLPRGGGRSPGGAPNLSELMGQLDALAEQVRGQLDERSEQVRELLAETEGRLRELQAARDASAAGAQRMEQLAGQIARRLDERSAALEQFLAGADAKIGELQSAAQQDVEAVAAHRWDERTAAMEQLLAGADAKIDQLQSVANQAVTTVRQFLNAPDGPHQQLALRTGQVQQLLDASEAKAADLRTTIDAATAGARQIQDASGQIQKAVENRLSEMTELLEGADGRIRELVAQVDARLAELRAAMDASPPPAAEQVPSPEVPPLTAPAGESLEELSALWQPSAPAEEAPGTEAPAPARDVEDKPGAVGPKHMDIFRLYDQGLDAVEIARQLAMNVGSVELILNLRRSREQDPTTRDAKP